MKETIVVNELRPGIELLEFRGTSGYETEHLMLSNSVGNGLRFEIMDDGNDDEYSSNVWWCFHINSSETARLIAAKLLEWSERIADPPAIQANGLAQPVDIVLRPDLEEAKIGEIIWRPFYRVHLEFGPNGTRVIPADEWKPEKL